METPSGYVPPIIESEKTGQAFERAQEDLVQMGLSDQPVTEGEFNLRLVSFQDRIDHHANNGSGVNYGVLRAQHAVLNSIEIGWEFLAQAALIRCSRLNGERPTSSRP